MTWRRVQARGKKQTIMTAVPTRAPSSLESANNADRANRRWAIALICLTYILFACLDTSAKWLSNNGIGVLQVVWARYAGAAALALATANPITSPGVLKTRRLGLQLARAATLVGSTLLNFFALRYLQLAETVSISFAMPLLVALLAGPMLGEWVGPRRLAAICVGFVGVLLVVRPGSVSFHPAMLLIMLAVVCYALYGIWTRVLAGHDSSATTLVYSSLPATLLLTPMLPWIWQTPQTITQWLVLAGTGLFASIGHYFLIRAHRLAPAAILAPFIYGELIWMVLLGYWVFGDVPGGLTLLGGAVVIGSGLYLWWRERRVKVS